MPGIGNELTATIMSSSMPFGQQADVIMGGLQTVSADGRTWTITELADEFGVTLRTLRFYEEHGLLKPERRGTHRVFRPGDRVRLELVLRGKRLGFPLDEIKKIVGMYDTEPGEAGQLAYLLHQIAVRRSELEQRRLDIEQTLGELDALERRCRDDLARLGSPAADGGVRA